jgi:hypothetical protein
MKFQFFISIFFLLSLSTCAPNDRKSYSLSNFDVLFRNLKQRALNSTSLFSLFSLRFYYPSFITNSKIFVKFEGSSDYVNYVYNYFNGYPLDCLNEALDYDLEINNIFFANLFFKIISGRKNEDYHLLLSKDPFQIAIDIRDNINLTIQKIFFEPFDSLVELQDNILVVRLLIKFLKRYSIFSPGKNYEKESGLVSKQIADWENLMSYLLEKSPHGDIDYNFIISFVRLPNGNTDRIFPPEDDKFKTNCLIFASYLNQLIRRKDFNIFKFDHPNLVFFLAFILDITDEYGNINTSEYNSSFYYNGLKGFFDWGIELFKLLQSIRNKKASVLRKSTEKVGGEIFRSYWISSLAIRFEEYFDEHPSEENRTLLFQLKCLAIMGCLQESEYKISTG